MKQLMGQLRFLKKTSDPLHKSLKNDVPRLQQQDPGGPGEAPVRKSMVLWRGFDRFEKYYQILSMKVDFLATRQTHVQKHLIKVKKNKCEQI